MAFITPMDILPSDAGGCQWAVPERTKSDAYDRNPRSVKAVFGAIAYIHDNPVCRQLCEMKTLVGYDQWHPEMLISATC